jgi:DNA-binding Lrp family transcriptional regulator
MLKKILKILEEDSRTTPEQIATMLGVSAEDVALAVSKAEDEGKILKYKTLINWD